MEERCESGSPLIDAERVPAAMGPDFFIVGAPKCATTALTAALADHPEIAMAAMKESHYFAGPGYWERFGAFRGDRPPSWEEYLALFPRDNRARRRGEASVWYLHAGTAPPRIHDHRPDADIIAMIRNPLDMIPSLHSQLVYIGIEPERDLGRVLAREAAGQRPNPPGFPAASYRAAANYAEQLHRYLATFGRDHLHVVVYDAFARYPEHEFQATCRFLGVGEQHPPRIERLNANAEARSRSLARLLVRPPSSVGTAVSRGVPGPWRRRAGTALQRWNTRVRPRGPVTREVAIALEPLVQTQVDALRSLLGLDLTGWLEDLEQVLVASRQL